MKLIYVGESPGRDIPIPGGVISCEHGVPFDIPDDIGASLLDQSIYKPAPVAAKKEKS